MEAVQIFWLCVIICLLGTGSIIGIILFGRFLFLRNLWKAFPDMFHHPFWEMVLMRMEKSGYYRDLNFITRSVSESFVEFLERRNEFWTTYGQVVITVLILVVLTILLLTKTISAEAGLPILSGISGFAIAKGVSSSKKIGTPSEKEQG